MGNETIENETAAKHWFVSPLTGIGVAFISAGFKGGGGSGCAFPLPRYWPLVAAARSSLPQTRG